MDNIERRGRGRPAENKPKPIVVNWLCYEKDVKYLRMVEKYATQNNMSRNSALNEMVASFFAESN